MSGSVIADNWSLQNISELLTNGIESINAHFVEPDIKNDSHGYKPIQSGVVAIEALFDLITDIILRNQILVDEKFSGTWFSDNGPLNKLTEKSVVRAYPFLQDPQKLDGPRDEFTARLCLTGSLKREHEENFNGWKNFKTTPHPYLSQILWGGAGMLARAFVYEKGYTPHPVRKRFFQKADIAFPDNDSVVRTCNTIEEKRALIRALQSGNDELYSLQVNIAPLPLLVLREANSPANILPVALQMRECHLELRNWLGVFQQAINDGDTKAIQKHHKTLRSISQYVDSFMGNSNPDAATFTAGIDVLKIAIKGSPINLIRNQFGVRSMINKLILGPAGNAELKKLLKFFGHNNTTVGMKIQEHFSSRPK